MTPIDATAVWRRNDMPIHESAANRAAHATVRTAPSQPESAGNMPENEEFWGEDGFTFGDFVDLINPLQHLPVVSTIYRALTGDEISPGARIVGDTLFGGIPGLIGSVINTAVEEFTGKDLGEHAIALFDADEPDAAPPVMVADNADDIETAEGPPTATLVAAVDLAKYGPGSGSPAVTAQLFGSMAAALDKYDALMAANSLYGKSSPYTRSQAPRVLDRSL